MTRKLLSFALALSCVCGASLLSPASRAVEPVQKVAHLGFVGPASPSTDPRGIAAFRERLGELGYIEGKNLIIEERWAEGRFERLPALVGEILAQDVEVLVTYGTPASLAAKNATNTIPIVVATMGDPVGAGVAASLARPGSNLTGLSFGLAEGLAGKWLETLQDAFPQISTIAVMANPDNPLGRDVVRDLGAFASERSLKLHIIGVRSAQGLDRAFQQARRHARAAVVVPDSIFVGNLQMVTALAARYRLPTIYGLREFADAGGLMSYGADRAVMFRRAAEYVDKILKGARPGDLPIEQPTKFELVVNLKTAKALGITIPESILLRADEVIR
jgi:putative tryptophan/tyrosine transport system substrate-binding protein